MLARRVSERRRPPDTSDYYGARHPNQMILSEALHPYRDDLVIVTKVGARRGGDGSWIPRSLSPAELAPSGHDNLRHLGLDVDRGGQPAQHAGHPRTGRRLAQDTLTALAELQYARD